MNNTDYCLQCQEILRNAVCKLGFSLREDKICEISKLITEAMGGVNRYFHNFEHILMFSNHDDPMIIIAGLFHDLIYVQVDGKIPFNLTAYLTPFIEEKSGSLFIKSHFQQNSKYAEIVLAIFGLKLGDNLSNFRGQNEFLSALCLAQIFYGYLPLPIIVRLMTIVELTIPFRGKENNLTVAQQLEIRLQKINQKFELNLAEKEIILTISQGIEFANIDVIGFASDNVKDFIRNTWLLFLETNYCLNHDGSYNIKDYCIALIKTTKFISSLSPEIIFHQYHNYPSHQDYQLLINKSRFNLEIGRCYFIYHVISFSVLHALINSFTTSLPLSFLFSHSHILTKGDSSFVSLLPTINENKYPREYQELEVINLLKSELTLSLFPYGDLENFVSFMVYHLNLNTLLSVVDQCYLFFDDKITGDTFLSLFPSHLIEIMRDAIASFLTNKTEVFEGK